MFGVRFLRYAYVFIRYAYVIIRYAHGTFLRGGNADKKGISAFFFFILAGVIRDYRLAFKALGSNAFAAIEACEGEPVPVAAWRISHRNSLRMRRMFRPAQARCAVSIHSALV